MNAKRKALGRGLSALLDTPEALGENHETIKKAVTTGSIAEIELKYIKTNPFQPRTDFDQNAIDELAQSLKEQGLIQPITLRILGPKEYQLISGERRFRAATQAGFEKLPAYIRSADDNQMLEMALVENIQRQDLNAIEVAITYNRLLEECQLTQEELSKRMGKNRTTITNYLRLLKLNPDVQIAIRDGRISMGHARAIVSLDDHGHQADLLMNIIENELSVRQAEQLVKDKTEQKEEKKLSQKTKNILPEKYSSIQNDINKGSAYKLDIKRNLKGKGKIQINFKNDKELEYILDIIQKNI